MAPVLFPDTGERGERSQLDRRPREREGGREKRLEGMPTLVPLLQLLLVKVCRLLQFDQLLLRELGLSVVCVVY